MYVAVSNLGAGGTEDVSLSDTSNAVLYAMFALTGLVGGGVNNCECSPGHCRKARELNLFCTQYSVPVLRYLSVRLGTRSISERFGGRLRVGQASRYTQHGLVAFRHKELDGF